MKYIAKIQIFNNSRAAFIFIAFCASMLLTTSTGITQDQIWYPKSKAHSPALRRLLVLPPKVSMSELGLVTNKELDAASEEAARSLWIALNRAFEESRIEVLDGPIAFANLQADAETNERLTSMQDEFAELNPNGKTIRLSSAIPRLKIAAGFDAMVLGQGRGSIPTKASKVRDAVTLLGALMSGGSMGTFSNELRLRLLLVETQSGAVLYYCETIARGNFINNADILTPFLKKALKKLNRAVELPR